MTKTITKTITTTRRNASYPRGTRATNNRHLFDLPMMPARPPQFTTVRPTEGSPTNPPPSLPAARVLSWAGVVVVVTRG
jgi:hypothetical protein